MLVQITIEIIFLFGICVLVQLKLTAMNRI